MKDLTLGSPSDQVTQTVYRILVSGILDEKWVNRTNGMAISSRFSENRGNYTELVGILQDEAALMGVLSSLYDHGVKLLRVEQVHEHKSVPNGSDCTFLQ